MNTAVAIKGVPVKSRVRWMLVVLTALALSAAACGGGTAEEGAELTDGVEPTSTEAAAGPTEAGTEPTAAEPTAAEPTAAEPTDGAAAAGDFELQQEGTIVVGSDIAFAPFEFVEDGENRGFDIDLMNEIASRLGLEAEFVNTGFDTLFTQVAAGQFDAGMSAITITEEREQTVDFSDPYFAANQAIAAPVEADISGPEDLAGLTVGVQAATTGFEYAQNNFTDATITEFPTSEAAFTALRAGQLDAVFIDLPVAAENTADSEDLEVKAEVDTNELYGIAFPPESDNLTQAVNDALQEIISDGTYAEIYSQWFEGDVPGQFQAE